MLTLDPLQLQANLTAAAGNGIAQFLLTKTGGAAVKGLTDLATALPQIPLGKVPAFQMGVITAELQMINSKVNASVSAGEKVGNPVLDLNALENQVGSVISLVSNSQASASGGAPTAEQGMLVAAAMAVASGIENYLAFWAGQQSVLNPAPALSAPTA